MTFQRMRTFFRGSLLFVMLGGLHSVSQAVDPLRSPLSSRSTVSTAVSTSLRPNVKQNRLVPPKEKERTAEDERLPLWDAETILQKCEQFLAQQIQKYDVLLAQSASTPSVQTLIIPWNALHAEAENVSGIIGLIENVSPVAAIRDASEQCDLKLSAASLDILQNVELYNRLKATPVQSDSDRRWKEHMLRQFQEAGAHLDVKKRNELKVISRELDAHLNGLFAIIRFL
jgi:Zn-dependent oligopeptidase